MSRHDNALAERALQLFRAQQIEAALPLLEQLLAAGDTPLPCILALADAREATGNDSGAIRLLEAVHDTLPRADFAVAWVAALQRAGDRDGLDKALPRLRAAYPDDARLAAMQAEHLLKRGDYGTGFDLLPARWTIATGSRMTAGLACPAWDGQPFPGTLLVGTEQGLGDVVLWSSMFADLARLGQKTLIACDARLLPLFRRSFPGLAFADAATGPLRHPGADMANRHVESADLGRWFRRTGADFPGAGGWLQADPARCAALREQWRAHFPGKRLVGLSWRSHRLLRNDSKSIPVTDFAPLLQRTDTVAVNLQYGDTAPDMTALHDAGLPLPAAPGIDVTADIDGLAALACALDTVVTSSSSLAHLAGALGLDTRLLVPGARYVLWYWGYDGERTPWYPSLRIRRGPPQNAWRALAATL